MAQLGNPEAVPIFPLSLADRRAPHVGPGHRLPPPSKNLARRHRVHQSWPCLNPDNSLLLLTRRCAYKKPSSPSHFSLCFPSHSATILLRFELSISQLLTYSSDDCGDHRPPRLSSLVPLSFLGACAPPWHSFVVLHAPDWWVRPWPETTIHGANSSEQYPSTWDTPEPLASPPRPRWPQEHRGSLVVAHNPPVALFCAMPMRRRRAVLSPANLGLGVISEPFRSVGSRSEGPDSILYRIGIARSGELDFLLNQWPKSLIQPNRYNPIALCNIPRFYQILEWNFCFVLLVLIEISQGFKTFEFI
jgi:hypothetical protein